MASLGSPEKHLGESSKIVSSKWELSLPYLDGILPYTSLLVWWSLQLMFNTLIILLCVFTLSDIAKSLEHIAAVLKMTLVNEAVMMKTFTLAKGFQHTKVIKKD